MSLTDSLTGSRRRRRVGSRGAFPDGNDRGAKGLDGCACAWATYDKRDAFASEETMHDLIAMLSGPWWQLTSTELVSCMKLPGVGVLGGVEGRVAKVDGVEGADAGGRGDGPWCR